MLTIVCDNDVVFDLALKEFQDDGNTVAVVDRVRKCFVEKISGKSEAVFTGFIPPCIEKFQKFVQSKDLFSDFFSFTVSPDDITGFLSEEDLDCAVESFNTRSTSYYIDPSVEVEVLTCVDGPDKFEVFIPRIVTVCDGLEPDKEPEFYIEQQIRLEKEFWRFVKSCEKFDGTYRSGKEKCHQKK